MSSRGYAPIETPLVERSELFLRRSGGVLSSQLFDFVAPDGSEVCLRPELTAPVLRHALGLEECRLPMRFQYAAPIFRYSERPYDAPPNVVPSKREFVQAGGELVGVSRCQGDGEIIALAYETAVALGVSDVRLRVGHVGLIWELLDAFNLSDRGKHFLANVVSSLGSGISDLSEVESEAGRLGLLADADANGIEAQASAADLLSRLAAGSIRLPGDEGLASRSSEDVVVGLRKKLASAQQNVDFSQALSTINRVANIRGRLGEACREMQTIASTLGLLRMDSLDSLSTVVDAAVADGVPSDAIEIDLGLATAVAYYSGMIFDVSAVSTGDTISLGGGGRYDGLASALGSPDDIPALGFAINLDVACRLSKSEADESSAGATILVPANLEAIDQVVARAAALRREGRQVFVLYDPEADVEGLKSASGDEVVVIGKNGAIE